MVPNRAKDHIWRNNLTSILGGTGFMKASVSEAGLNRETRLGVTQVRPMPFVLT